MGNTLEKTAQGTEKKVSLSMKQYGMMLALIAVYIIFAVITGGKNLSPLNVNNLIMQNGYVVILAVGMLLCVLTGNVDLGVGSVVASCGAVAGTLLVDFGMSTPVQCWRQWSWVCSSACLSASSSPSWKSLPSLSPWLPCSWAAASATSS